jgi:hypothetical protein
VDAVLEWPGVGLSQLHTSMDEYLQLCLICCNTVAGYVHV